MKLLSGNVATANSPIGAFFDVDNTLIPGSATEIRFFHYLRRHGVVGWNDAARSVWHLLRAMPPVSLHPLRERKLYLEGKRRETIEPLAEAFVHAEMRPRMARAGIARLEEHQRLGHCVVFITGCPEFLIRPLAKLLGVETTFCARPEQIEGAYTGRLVPPLPYGDGKRQLIQQFADEHGLDLKDCHAYGDSPGDVETLLSVGHPLVVNPIRGMETFARRYGWPVVRWE